jgi:hypothetical protein
MTPVDTMTLEQEAPMNPYDAVRGALAVIEMLNEAEKNVSAAQMSQFHARVLGSLTVLIPDPAIWKRALETANECMRKHCLRSNSSLAFIAFLRDNPP